MKYLYYVIVLFIVISFLGSVGVSKAESKVEPAVSLVEPVVQYETSVSSFHGPIQLPGPVYIPPVKLSSNFKNRKGQISTYLEWRGKNVKRWMKIIKGESGFDPKSEASTYWSQCSHPVRIKLWGFRQSANRFIELRDYPSGRIWQATCEEVGAVTVRTGNSVGLTHIIETTWENLQCMGDRLNWKDNLECAFKIKKRQGWNAWSTS